MKCVIRNVEAVPLQSVQSAYLWFVLYGSKIKCVGVRILVNIAYYSEISQCSRVTHLAMTFMLLNDMEFVIVLGIQVVVLSWVLGGSHTGEINNTQPTTSNTQYCWYRSVCIRIGLESHTGATWYCPCKKFAKISNTCCRRYNLHVDKGYLSLD